MGQNPRRMAWFVVVLLVFGVLTLTVLASDGAFAGPSSAKLHGGWQVGPQEVHPERILVRFAESFAARGVQASAERLQGMGLQVERTAHFNASKRFPRGLDIHVVTIPKGSTVSKEIGRLSKDPDVFYAEPDYKVYRDTPVVPDDTYFNMMWGLNNPGAAQMPPEADDPQLGAPAVADSDIDMPEGWAIRTDSPTIIVGLIDTGVYIDHPDLADHIWTNPDEIPDNGVDDDANGYIDDVHGWDFYNNDNSVWDPNQRDQYGYLNDEHGTHTAGTIGALSNNAMGVAGINWDIKIIPLKFIGPQGGYTSDAILALNYAAAKGAVLTSNSWGGGGYEQALKDAIEGTGMLFVAAAGNSGSNNDVSPHYPSSYDSPNIVAVAASMQNDYPAYYPGWWGTCYGANSVDLFAPGGYILSSVPPDPPPGPGEPPEEAYAFFYGTSMATPHVSGVAALLISEFPDLPLYPGAPGWTPGSPSIKSVIMDTTDRKPQFEGMVVSGGRLNAANALAASLPPVIDEATATPTEGAPPLLVSFTASAHDVDGSIVDTYWDFGDGSPQVHEGETTHTYTSQGYFDATFHAVDDAGLETVATIPIHVFLPPDIDVNPLSMQASLDWGEQETQDLTISNNGTGDLHYTIAVQPGGAGTAGASGATPKASYPRLELAKGEADPRLGPAVTDSSGGPDQFGYIWIDSDTVGGPVPTFQWIELSGVGTPVSLGDDNGILVSLPFTFPFYGQPKTQIRIASNGYLTFGGDMTDYTNDPIPDTSDPNDMIAPFWDDLNQSGGQILHYGDPVTGTFVVEYKNVTLFGGAGSYTFEVILSPSGSIKVQYLNVQGPLTGATVGIENAGGTDGLQVAFNQAYVHDNLALAFYPLWIDVTPKTGAVPPGGSASVGVTFRAGTMAEGDYPATLVVQSDDPEEPVVNVATQFHVNAIIPPVIDSLDAAPWAGKAPLTVDFTARAHDADGLVVSSSWDFGDGSAPVDGGAPVNGELHVSHTYTTDGEYDAVLTVTDDEGLTATRAVHIVVRELPKAEVYPPSFRAAVRAHRTRTETLTIRNEGDAPLNFTLSAETAAIPGGAPPRVAPSLPFFEGAKGEADPRPGRLGSGGPDVFGYMWIDSDTLGGPTYSWVDITGVGTPHSLGDDEGFSVSLPWTFTFYGNERTSIGVSANGYMSFGPYLSTYWNQSIPSSSYPNDLFAAYWDDLYPPDGGTVYHYHDSANDRFIVEWYNVPDFGSGRYTFEAILYPNGKIVYQYNTMNVSGNSATIGIENASGTDGLEVAFNHSYVHSGLAIQFAPFKWLSTDITSGTVAPGDSLDAQVLFDLRPIASGSLDGRLVLQSNDVLHPEIVVPVHVDVLENQRPVITAAGVNPPRGPLGTQFQFVAAANDPDGSIADKWWSFGDGSAVVHEFSTLHQYAANGLYTATFHAVDNDGYETTAQVTVEVGQPPSASWNPHQIFMTVAQGRSVSSSLTLSNAGPGLLRFGAATSGQSIHLPRRLTGSGAAAAARAKGTKGAAGAQTLIDPLSRTAQGLYAPLSPQERADIQPFAVGDILTHWTAPSPIGLAWGVGVNLNSGILAISDPNQNKDFLVTPSGTYTGTSWNTSWAGVWSGDMAFDGQYLWQVSVGGSNGIYQLDPLTGAVQGSITSGAWTGTSQRGLAYDANDDTFYIAGWNEDIIYHFKGLSWSNPGEVLEQWSMPVSISGLAYHPGTNILVVVSNAAPDTIYFVNAATHAIVAQFAHPAGGDYGGAGIEFDSDGNLWIASQSNNSMYLVETNLGPIGDWLRVTPESGAVVAGSSAILTVSADSRNLTPGDHNGSVAMATNDPENPQIVVPVQVHVARAPVIIEATATPTLGEPPLAVTFHAAVQAPETPLASVQWSFGDGSAPVATLDATHTYTAQGMFLATFTATDTLGGSVSTQIAIDVRYLPRATVDPTALEVTLPANAMETRTVTIGNVQGHAPLNFKVKVRQGAAPTVALPERNSGASVNPLGRSAQGLYKPFAPEIARRVAANVVPDGVGDVITSWPTPSPITMAWGAGFDETNVWIGDPQVKTDYLVTPEGSYTGTAVPTPWAGAWAGDMAYDKNHNLMWQVNVGGDNGIYGLDPATGGVVNSITSGPWTGVSQRGLAYDAATDTFYIAGWNQDIIYHIKGLDWDQPGQVIEAYSFPVSIAGLAWHPNGILWVSTNSSPDMIYGCDLANLAVVYQFPSPAGGSYLGAGLTLNSDGNLWVTTMNNYAYLVDTDMPISQGISVQPTSGSIPAGQSQTLTVTINAPELGDPGRDYANYLEITTNDPFSPLLPVNMLVHISAAPTVSDVTATPSVGEPPLEVSFSATVHAGAAPITDVWWDFGDGSAPVHQTTATHVYSDLGTYDASIHARDANGVEASEKVQIKVAWLPVLGTAPESFEVFLTEGQQEQRDLTISNNGHAPLNFHLALAPSFGDTPQYKRFAAGDYVKGDFAKEPHGWPVTYGAGGPDAFGYMWMDSEEEGGPVYNWVELSDGLGTPISLTDESAVTVTLPFAFPYYGQSKSQIAITSNGYLTFGPDTRGFYENAPIPSTSAPNDILAAFWDDLDPGVAGGVYYYNDEANNRFIVEFSGVPQWGSTNSYTFQIILRPDGSIVYQYSNMTGDLMSATVGIENGDGATGLEVVYNSQFVKNGLAVGFTPIGSVLAVNPNSGYLVPGYSQGVVVTFGSPQAAPGVYRAAIRVMADDPYRPVALVPVALDINGIPKVTLQQPTTGSVVEGVTAIKWTAKDDDTLTIDLAYSADGGANWTTLAQGVANTGSFDWDTRTVPVGDTYQVQVTAADPHGQKGSAKTGNFTIRRAPQVTLTAPAGGDIITTGTTNVVWTASDAEDGANVKINLEYTKNDGQTWKVIAYNLTNSGLYTWTLTGVGPSDQIQVRITATDQDGGKAEVVSGKFTVTQAPVAAFTYAPADLTQTGADDPVQFTDQSTDPDGDPADPIATWQWTFGDRQSSTEKNPQHKYSHAGVYTVRLQVTDKMNARSNVAWSTLVVGSTPAPINGYVTAMATPGDFELDGTTQTDVYVRKSGTGTPEFTLARYEANPTAPHAATFRDAAAFFDVHLGGPGAPEGVDGITVQWYWPTEADPAKWTVYWFDEATGRWTPVSNQTLIATDKSQSEDMPELYGGYIRMSLDAASSPSIGQLGGTVFAVGIPHIQPTAAFSLSPIQPTVSDTVQFTDASAAGEGTLVGWLWTFGDGQISTQRNPSHRYAARGTYTVTLTVTDDAGATASAAKTVTVVNSAPAADFSFAPAAPKAGEAVQFTDGSSDLDGASDITARSWEFGDGQTSTEQSPKHQYAAKGAYTVKLTVTDGAGASATATKTLTVVNSAPAAAFSFAPAAPTVRDTVQFTDSSTDPDGATDLASWSWEFGDSKTGAEQNPKHKYAAKGTYTVKLTVTDKGGAASTSQSELRVVNLPPEVTLIAPVAGDVWTGKRAIQWQATDPDDAADKLQVTLAYSADGSSWTDIATVDGTSASYLWDTSVVAKGGRYQVQITVTDPDSAKAVATSDIFTIVKVSGLVAVGPNPANSTVTFYFALAEDASGKLFVYDSSGRLVHQHEVAEGETHHVWNLSNANGLPLAPGLYLFVLATDKGEVSKVQRLVIER